MTRRMWILLAIFILGCIAEAVIVPWACGQDCADGSCRISGPTPTNPHPAVCRINNTVGRMSNLGTGTLIEASNGRGVVLTCAHLFREGVGNITVKFADGSFYEARMLGRDATWDLAALEITAPAASPVAIADGYPRRGEPVKSCGYGPNGQYACNSGRVLGYTTAQGTSSFEWFDLTGVARDGDSGGPVFDASGRLCGVLWGTDGRTVGATYCGRIRKFLANILGRSREQPPVGGNGAGNAPHADGASGGQDVPPPPVPPMAPVEKPSCDAIALLKAEIQSQIDGLRADILEFRKESQKPVQDAVQAIDARLKPLESARSDTDGAIAAILESVEQLRKQPAQLPPGESERIANISEALVAVSERTEQIEQRTSSEKLREVIREAVPVVAETGWAAAAKSALPGVLTALGWSTPPSAAIAAAWFGLKLLRRRRQKKSRAAEATTTTQQPTVIVQESKPLPQVVIRDPEYIPFEVPTKRQKAMEMAQDYFVQKHPGAASTIEVLKQYADQFESGLKSPQ